ncbi:MAG TPA: hypothetical protein VGA96_12575, partial [Fibrella sp.]
MSATDTNNQHSEIADELAVFRKNKRIPLVIEKSVLQALSFYPELHNTPISFGFKRSIKSSV